MLRIQRAFLRISILNWACCGGSRSDCAWVILRLHRRTLRANFAQPKEHRKMPQHTDAAATHQLDVTLGERLATLNGHLGKLNARVSAASDKLGQLGDSINAATHELKTLNATVLDASKASERLARALNWLTAVGAVAALAGAVVAIIAMAHHWG